MELTQLHLKEYEKLQNQIADIIAEIGSVEKYAVTTSGGIFAWLFANQECLNHEYAYYLPTFVSLLFGVITYGLFHRAKLIAGYIRSRYESLMSMENNPKLKFGWETYLDKSTDAKGSWLAYGRLALWIILISVNLAIAIFLR